jgi:hypothetical protein
VNPDDAVADHIGNNLNIRQGGTDKGDDATVTHNEDESDMEEPEEDNNDENDGGNGDEEGTGPGLSMLDAHGKGSVSGGHIGCGEAVVGGSGLGAVGATGVGAS